MAIYHFNVKTIGRSQGRNAINAAAYRAGVSLHDERTGELFNYARKRGVEHTEILSPIGVKLDRESLWNNAELAETRKNSTVAREYEIALPSELTTVQRKDLALTFAQHLVSHYGVAADVAIHAPSSKGDQRNFHAHILTTTRQVSPNGMGAKTRALDDRKTGEIERLRTTWAELANQALARTGHDARVSHKSLDEQGIERIATIHMGPAATAMERRGERTYLGNINRQVLTLNADLAAIRAKEAHEKAERLEARLQEVKLQKENAQREAERRAEEARLEAERRAKARSPERSHDLEVAIARLEELYRQRQAEQAAEAVAAEQERAKAVEAEAERQKEEQEKSVMSDVPRQNGRFFIHPPARLDSFPVQRLAEKRLRKLSECRLTPKKEPQTHPAVAVPSISPQWEKEKVAQAAAQAKRDMQAVAKAALAQADRDRLRAEAMERVRQMQAEKARAEEQEKAKQAAQQQSQGPRMR